MNSTQKTLNIVKRALAFPDEHSPKQLFILKEQKKALEAKLKEAK